MNKEIHKQDSKWPFYALLRVKRWSHSGQRWLARGSWQLSPSGNIMGWRSHSLDPQKPCATPKMGSTAGKEWRCLGAKRIRFVKENELWPTVINQPVTSSLSSFNFTSIGNFPPLCFIWWNPYLGGRRFISIILNVYSGRDSRETVWTAACFYKLSKYINNN